MSLFTKKSLTSALLKAGVSKSHASALISGTRMPSYGLAAKLEADADIPMTFWRERPDVKADDNTSSVGEAVNA